MTIQLQDKQTGEGIRLDAVVIQGTFTVTFIVRDDSGFIENASIDIDGNTLTTDVNGEASIELDNDTYSYVISKADYEDYAGTITGKGEDITEVATIELAFHTVTIYTTFNDEALAGVTVNVDGADYVSDSFGKIEVSLQNGSYPYTASLDGYADNTGTITISDLAVVEFIAMSLPSQLSDYIDKMPFWAGDFDFDTNKVADQTGNTTGADIVDIPCIQIVSDVTITTSTSVSGLTVVKVNEDAGATAGVSVSGDDIQITAANLTVTDNKIWSIELSDGQIFVLQSTVSPYIFSKNNIGTLSGVENTDWSHALSDEAYPYHLANGFTRTAFADTVKKTLVDGNPRFTEEDSWSIKWTGSALSNVNFFSVFALPFAPDNIWYPVLVYNRLNGELSMYSRVAGVKLIATTIATGLRTIEVELFYNGEGYDNEESWSMKVFGNLITPSFYDSPRASNDRGIIFPWAGNGTLPSDLIVRDFSFKLNGANYVGIENGYIQEQLLLDLPDGYIYITNFDNANALGLDVTNLPATDGNYNAAPLKFRLPVDSNISDNDVNNILYTDPTTPNALDLREFYDNYNNKIHCDTSNFPYVKNFLVTNEAIDLREFLNGVLDAQLYSSIRTDTDGFDDAQSLRLIEVVTDNNIRVDAHTYIPNFGTGDWLTKSQLNDIANALHLLQPTFWKYKNDDEGREAYNAATTAEKTAETVILNQGKIGYTATGKTAPIDTFQNYVNNYGFIYPEGVTPDVDDNNGEWWDWILSEFDRVFGLSSVTISSFTELGAIPAGIHGLHPNLARKVEALIYGDNSGTDELSTLFLSGKDVEVVDDSGTNVNKLDGSATDKTGRINVGDYIFDEYCIFEFDFKFITAVSSLSLVTPTANSVASFDVLIDADVSFDGNDYAYTFNPDVYYRCRVSYVENFYYISIFDASGTCVLMTRQSGVSGRGKISYIKASGGVVYVKNLNIRSALSNERKLYGIVNTAKYDDDSIGGAGAYTPAGWKEVIEKELLNGLHSPGLAVSAIFSHQIRSASLEPDSPYELVMRASYENIDASVKWMLANGVDFRNSYDQKNSNDANYDKRINLFKNGNFNDELFGYSGEVWGMSGLTVDATETAASSIDGSNVVSVDTDVQNSIRLLKGKYVLKFLLKGTLGIGLIEEGTDAPHFTQYNITRADYEMVLIPFEVFKDNPIINVSFLPTGTPYMQKLELAKTETL